MERLWLREVRRAARRASAPFARQIALGCGAAAVGTMAASLLPLQVDGSVAQAVPLQFPLVPDFGMCDPARGSASLDNEGIKVESRLVRDAKTGM